MTEDKGLFIVFAVFVSLWLIPFFISGIALPSLIIGGVEDDFKGGSILFVGDVMLGRHVETLMNEKGPNYPFGRIEGLIKSVDVSVGNFEGSVPEKHVQTPDHSLIFSMHEHSLESIKSGGLDIVSLANNHSFDYLDSGYMHTLKKCKEYGLICRGNPNALTSISTTNIRVGDTLVGLVFLYAASFEVDDPLLEKVLMSVKKSTQEQIVFIHWGDEYETEHSPEQEELAHLLIESGVDAVIGHHPHVVQDIELYKGKPIFYSLGNFIFDQYFDDAVQIGLSVRLELAKDTLEYTLIPISSMDSPSQPRIMSIDQRDRFLSELEVRGAGEYISGRSTVVVER